MTQTKPKCEWTAADYFSYAATGEEPRMQPDPHTEAVIEAQRDALAIAVHAAREDAAAVALTWNANESREQLIYRMARLPYLLVKGYGAAHDEEVDFTEQCEAMLRGLPHTVGEVDELADGRRPFADKDDDNEE